MKVVTISRWLNFGRPAPGKGVCGWRKFLAPLYYSQRSVCVSPSAFSLLLLSLSSFWRKANISAAVVKVVMWSRGGLAWRSQVGANPIPIPHHPLIWRYLGIKLHFIVSIRGGGSYYIIHLYSQQKATARYKLIINRNKRGLESEQGELSPPLPLTLTTVRRLSISSLLTGRVHQLVTALLLMYAVTNVVLDLLRTEENIQDTFVRASRISHKVLVGYEPNFHSRWTSKGKND